MITLQLLRLEFFNSITNFFLSISYLNHFLLLSTYYLFPVCCTVPNDLKIFKHVPTYLKEWIQGSTTMLDIFSYKCEFVKCNCPFFQRTKFIYFHFKHYYLAIYMVEIFEFFLHIFLTQHNLFNSQDFIVTCVQKCFFSKIWCLY